MVYRFIASNILLLPFTGAQSHSPDRATEIRKDPKGAKRHFLRLVSHKIQNGRCDINRYLVDEEGDLLALTDMLVLQSQGGSRLMLGS